MRYILLFGVFVFILFLFNKREYFQIGGQSKQCPYDEIYDDVSGSCVPRKQCNKETEFYDRESNTCVERPDFETAYNEYLDRIPDPIEKKEIEYVKPDPKMTMDKRDFFMNLCPRDYNLKQIKLLEKMNRSNQLPGYTSITSFEAMRQIPDPAEPFPVDADFF